MFVLPRSTYPDSFKTEMTVASYGGTNGSRILDPAVLRTPFVVMTSLIAAGTPVSAPDCPFAISSSAFAACSSAKSAVIVINAFRRWSRDSIRSRAPRVSSTDENSRFARPFEAAWIVSSWNGTSVILRGSHGRESGVLPGRVRSPEYPRRRKPLLARPRA